MHREDRHVHARPHLHRQRRIERPAGGGGAARHEERTDQQDGRGRQQPEAEVVHPRKSHVGRADLQRNHPVREADEGRHDRAEHHDQAVQRGELVEQLRMEELQARLEQLQADQQCQRAAREQHREREQQVQRADILVVGREQPTAPAMRMVVRVVVSMTVRVILRVRNRSAHRKTPWCRFVTQAVGQPALRPAAARLACWAAVFAASTPAVLPAPPPSGILPPRASFTWVGCSTSLV